MHHSLPLLTLALTLTTTASALPNLSPRHRLGFELPYHPGTCKMHIEEYQTCADDPDDLWAIITIFDGADKEIGQTTSGSGNPYGSAINVKDPYTFQSKLPHDLVVVGEHRGDYVQFQYGELGFTSRTTAGNATCSNGGWNEKVDCKVAKIDMKTKVCFCFS